MKSSFARIILVSLMSLAVLPVYARGGGGFRGGGGWGGGSFDRGGADFNRGADHDYANDVHEGNDQAENNPGITSAENGMRNYGGSGFNSISSSGRATDRNSGERTTTGVQNWNNRSNTGAISGRDSAVKPMPADGGFGNIASSRSLPTEHATHSFTQNDLNNQGNQIRNSFSRYNFDNWNRYNGNWNNRAGFWGYPGAWYPGGWGAATAWECAGFATLGAYCGLADMSQPVYCDYGNDIVYQGDNVYVNGQPADSANDYYQQAQQLAAQAESADAPVSSQDATSASAVQDDWKPLGVFSLVQGKQTDSMMVMQLAINKQGILKGNYYNQITGESSQINGSLNKKTQRVAWAIGNNKGTVFDTSLGNLMKDQSPVLVHYSANNTQEMALVRVKEPAHVPSATS